METTIHGIYPLSTVKFEVSFYSDNMFHNYNILIGMQQQEQMFFEKHCITQHILEHKPKRIDKIVTLAIGSAVYLQELFL